jgi:hypothetical protein
MKIIILYLLSLFFPPQGMAAGLDVSNDPALVLEKLYTRLVSTSDDNDRLRINDSIKIIIESYAASDTVFYHRFNNLRYLGQITSPDSLVKIITWNLVLKNEASRYFCYFIKQQQQDKKNRVYSLTTTYGAAAVSTDTLYSASDWYGALYYDIKPCFNDNKQYWILLGVDYGNLLITRKIIEVLSFTADDSIIFGKKWFISGDEIKYRDVFEYGSSGVMSLRFNSEKSIFFDHLVPFIPVMGNDRQYYGADYTYDAYNYENGFWKLTFNVDARNKE